MTVAILGVNLPCWKRLKQIRVRSNPAPSMRIIPEYRPPSSVHVLVVLSLLLFQALDDVAP